MNDKDKFPFTGIMIIVLVFLIATIIMAFWPSLHGMNYEHMTSPSRFFWIPFLFILAIGICIWICSRRKYWSNMDERDELKRRDDKQKGYSIKSSVEILKNRLAKGEINEEEYDRILKKISVETPDRRSEG